MKRTNMVVLCLLIGAAFPLCAQSTLDFSVEEEVRQLSTLLELDRSKAVEIRAVSARFAARAAGLVDPADQGALAVLQQEKLEVLGSFLAPDQLVTYQSWLQKGNPAFASLDGSTTASAWDQSVNAEEADRISSSVAATPAAAPPTADGMATTQADYLDRRLQLSEEQYSKVVAMYSRFNQEFDRQRQRQEGTDISGIQRLLRNQQSKRDRELKRILNEGQFERYLELEGRAE
ncbi:MAG: hypothetical protein AAF433_21565 [Bacteroidota bacterium]